MSGKNKALFNLNRNNLKNRAPMIEAACIPHPEYGLLYGPFMHSTQEKSFNKIIKTSCLYLSDNNPYIIAYYPNLVPGSLNNDMILVLDLMERMDLIEPGLIFYTKEKPQLYNTQTFPGVEVCWFNNKKLDIIVAMSNVHGLIKIMDDFLIKAIKTDLKRMFRTFPLRKEALYQNYLDGLFAA